MGEQTSPVMLYMKANDGSWTKLCDVTEFSPLTGVQDTCEVATMEAKEISFSIKTPKNLRCKSRKRFVKLLMSIGLDRDTANMVVELYKIMRRLEHKQLCYQDLWYRCFWTKLEEAQKGDVTDVH